MKRSSERKKKLEGKKVSLSHSLGRVPDGRVGDHRVLFHDLAREREALGEVEVCGGERGGFWGEEEGGRGRGA